MNNVIRAFVIVLALTGAAASSQTLSASSHSKISVARNTALPTPMCPPDDPNACGIGSR